MIQKILITDDEPDILTAFSELLNGYGYEVFTASNSNEFERAFFAENPDLVIMDIVIGSESGPDIYDRVMRMSTGPKIPVVFASALVDSRSESPLVKGRQVAMYAKPLRIEKLVRDIRMTFSDSYVA